MNMQIMDIVLPSLARRLHRQLERYRAGECIGSADLNVSSILAWGKMARLPLSDHPEVRRWLDACLARPAYG